MYALLVPVIDEALNSICKLHGVYYVFDQEKCELNITISASKALRAVCKTAKTINIDQMKMVDDAIEKLDNFKNTLALNSYEYTLEKQNDKLRNCLDALLICLTHGITINCEPLAIIMQFIDANMALIALDQKDDECEYEATDFIVIL